MVIRLGPHFTLDELTVTSQKDADGNLLPNSPGLEELHNLRALVVSLLEPIRDLWGCPVRVTSGYRSHDVEMKVSGKDYGQHRLGQAADLVALGSISAAECMNRLVSSSLPFDQAILEQAGDKGPRWIHVSYTDQRAARRMALYTLDSRSGVYAFYQPGTLDKVLA